MRRIILFFAVNIFITLGLVMLAHILGISNYYETEIDGGLGINHTHLALFSLLFGMAGALISLAFSRVMAKWVYQVQVLDPQKVQGPERELLRQVYGFSRKAGLSTMPEVGIYHNSELNAFATGPTRNRSLVAVSTGLLENMNKEEVEGVLAHEVAHIANGDMVTMTLLQGVINTFVIFLSVIISSIIASKFSNRGNSSEGGGGSYYLIQKSTEFILHLVFACIGALITSWFSRHREYRADAGGAALAGPRAMKAALTKLLIIQDRRNPEFLKDAPVGDSRSSFLDATLGSRGQSGGARGDAALACLKINTAPRKRNALVLLFSTHPPLEDRINKLSAMTL